MKNTFAIVTLLAACTGSGSGITLTVINRPALVAYRTDHGAWTTPGVAGINGQVYSYALDPGTEYEIVVVCAPADSSLFQSNEILATSTDVRLALADWPPPCSTELNGMSPVAQVSGQMAQTGLVALGGSQERGSGNWQYSLMTEPGLKDLVAVADGRVVIRRNLQIDNSATEPTLDVSTEGTALASGSVSVAGGSVGEQESAQTEVITANSTGLTIVDALPAISILSSTQLGVNDEEYLDVMSTSLMSGRSASLDVAHSVPSQVALLPSVPGVTFGASSLSAAWSPISFPFTGVTAVFSGSNGTQSVGASKDWIVSHSASQLIFDDAVPGYLPEWTVSTHGPVSSMLEVESLTVTPYASYLSWVSSGSGAVARGFHHRALRAMSRSGFNPF